MITIVLVDDAPAALQALQDAARPWHDVWDIHVAQGAPAALALFETLPNVDVVVTNMDMAGMDGAELLTGVRERSPHTARIILSGRSEREALLRAVGPAHQYLPKPVDIDELARVVEHVRGASPDVLRDPIRSLIGQADRLPSPPELFQQLMDMIESPNWTVNGVADVLGNDVALTAEILKLVNSSFFGFFGDVSSVDRAVSLLGVDLIRSVVLGSKLFVADEALESWLDLELLDWRCKSIALGARSLALRDGASSETAATAYLTGMICEVGLLVMARVPDVNADIAEPLNDRTYLEVERAIFGGDRFVVSCQLLRLWGFSATIVDAIEQLGGGDGDRDSGLAWYLHAARRLVLDDGFDPRALAAPAGSVPDIDEALERVRLGSDVALITR